MSTVDVVVPCYNYGQYLERCIGTVVNQEGVDVRVLIIDDCSSDDTPTIGRRLSEADPRVHFRRHKINLGHIATYNEGLLEWASAEYTTLLSADDLLAPGALARAARLMDLHPEVGMTYGMTLVIVDDEMPAFTGEPAEDAHRILSGSMFLQHCFEEMYNPVPTPSVVVRTELQHRLGGYRPEYPHTGDFEMWMRFASQSSIGVLRPVQAYYRWHSQNMSQQYYGQPVGDLRELDEVCKRFLREYGSQFPESAFWSRLMARGLSKRAVTSASRAFNSGSQSECVARLMFAEELWPNVRYSGAWWRLAVKRLLGQSFWERLRPTLNSLRGLPDHARGRELFWSGLQQGWWPDE